MISNSCFYMKISCSRLNKPKQVTVSESEGGGRVVLGKLPVPGRPALWMIVGQGPTALAVGAGGGCLVIFTLIYLYSPLSPSLWETARYRLKYCLKGPLNPKQPTNQPTESEVLQSRYGNKYTGASKLKKVRRNRLKDHL